MTQWPIFLGILTLTACADPATSEQAKNAAARPAQAQPLPQRPAQSLPPQNLSLKVAPEPDMDVDQAEHKIDEITERLDYLRKYIGPKK